MSERRSTGGGVPPTTIEPGSTQYFGGSGSRVSSQGDQAQGGGTDQAQEKASQVAGQAQEKATQVAGQAQEKASQVAGQAQEKAGQVAAQAQEKATQVAEQATAKADVGIDKAAGGLDQAADMLRQKGEQMGGQGSAASSIVTQAATRLDAASQYLKDKDTDQLMTDLEGLVRRKPTQTLLVAAGVGFLLSKVVR
ncbi:MAG: hypothetical protein M3Q10_05635 [Chloroflexota bacterium]|nr:hypothetical protein [Chloroflexota bacterium]